MSETTERREVLERLATASSIAFVSVKPEPAKGPFPPQAVEYMKLEFTANGGLTVHSTENSGDGSFTLSDDGKTITFGGCSWTERGGDDDDQELQRRLDEAEEFMQAKFDSQAGPYGVSLQRDQLILTNQNDGTEIVFRVSP